LIVDLTPRPQQANMIIIKDYKIVSAGDTQMLEKAVKKEMIQGWIPAGGLCVAMVQSKNGVLPTFMQSMKKL